MPVRFPVSARAHVRLSGRVAACEIEHVLLPHASSSLADGTTLQPVTEPEISERSLTALS